MNIYRAYLQAAGGLTGWVLVACFVPFQGMAGSVGDKFDLLQIGTQTYTNVTVTTKAKDYIFLVHDGGMISIKTTELNLGLKKKLGYVPTDTPTNAATVWAKQELAKINVAPLAQLKQKHERKLPWGLSMQKLLASKALYFVGATAFVVYLFHCYCCMLICQKTGKPASLLVWLPVVQLFPLLRAAGMSGWWFLAYFVPLVNIVAHVLWCLNIAKARGKTVLVGVLLLLPVTGLFAFLYLAFSGGQPAQEKRQRQRALTFQAA